MIMFIIINNNIPASHPNISFLMARFQGWLCWRTSCWRHWHSRCNLADETLKIKIGGLNITKAVYVQIRVNFNRLRGVPSPHEEDMFSFRFGENELSPHPCKLVLLSVWREKEPNDNVEGGNDDCERKENLGRSFPTNSSGARQCSTRLVCG